MKIAFVTNHPLEGDGAPRRAGYQKTALSMFRALRAQGLELVSVPLQPPARPLRSYVAGGLCRIVRRGYLPHLEPAVLNGYARQLERWLARHGADLVLCPASPPVAHLGRSEPLVLWRDATFAGGLETHRSFRNLAARTIAQGHAMERRALARAALAIFRSDWAADSAIAHYGLDPARVRRVPTGGNLGFTTPRELVERQIAQRARAAVCRLLFVGVDWQSKGGDLCAEIAEGLRRRGVATELTVIGCDPPPGVAACHAVGFIDTRSDAGRRRLREEFQRAHFLVVPSRCEPYGNVFPEANAFGVPGIGSCVGGIPSIIRDGRNGFVFPLSAPAAAYVDCIEGIWRSGGYAALARSAFAEYEARLSWEVVGREVAGLLRWVWGGRGGAARVASPGD